MKTQVNRWSYMYNICHSQIPTYLSINTNGNDFQDELFDIHHAEHYLRCQTIS